MPTYFKPLNIVYIPIAKAACTTLKNLFLKECGITPKEFWHAHDIIEDRRFSSPFEFIKFEDAMQKNRTWKNVLFVRNPWTRMVSCYCDKISTSDDNSRDLVNGVYRGLLRFEKFRPAMPFKEFLKVVASLSDRETDIHMRSIRFDAHILMNDEIDWIGKTENLEADLRRLLVTSKVEKLHQQTKKPHRSYFTDQETIDLVSKRFVWDIETYNYKFEDLP